MTPRAASTSSISTSAAMSAPRARRVRPPIAEEVVAEERREDVGEVPEVERPGREAAALQTGVAVAVVQLARLGVRQHLVCLGDLAEPLLRVRRLGDVGVQLARELPERALDVLVARAARDAEQLVVVALGRRHSLFSIAGPRRRSRLRFRSRLFVDVFDEAGERGRRRLDRADRLVVVHPHRPDAG